jgi:hypothetical protein
MAAVTSNFQNPLAAIRALLSGLAGSWRRAASADRDDGAVEDAPWSDRFTFRLGVLAGIALLAAFWGYLVAVAGLNALYLCAVLIGCVFILFDYRIGAVLLILLMPISRSTVFPHAMLGITGLNPLNLLLIGTLGSYLLHALFDGSIRRFVPPRLLFFYITPILIAGVLGSRHVGEIPSMFYISEMLNFRDATGYLREFLVKPLSLVVFALLVGAAVAKSGKPERFLVPGLISIWVISVMIIVFVLLSGTGLGQLASSESREFLSALGMHANELGRLYAFAYALLLFMWAESRDPGLKAVLLASMALAVLAMVLTFSRGAFLGFMVVNVLFLLWRLNAKTLLVAFLLAGGAMVVLPGAVFDRVSSGFGQGLNAISAGRIEGLWLPLFPEVLRSPIYGSGLASILWSEPMRVGGGMDVLQVSHPHNAYLEAALDMGIVGLLLLLAYFAHVWRGFRRLGADADLNPLLRGYYLGAAAGLASLLIAAVTDSSLTPRPEQTLLWLAIGMMYGQYAKKPGGRMFTATGRGR